MKRNLLALSLILVLVLSLALTGCQKACDHEWKDADCDDPKTCELCDTTEGAPLGHTWKAATCNAAKVCETCGKVEGEALGHTWVDATCEKAKICSVCKTEEGEALGHSWEEATTEAPKTCTNCGKTEGEAIDTDDRFTTANCKQLFGTWKGDYVQSLKELGVDAEGTMSFIVEMTFHNDGTMELIMAPNPDTYEAEMNVYMTEFLYLSFEAQSMSRADADAYVQATFGMTMAEYVASAVAELDPDDQKSEQELVYYVEDGEIYAAEDWDEEMDPVEYTLEGDILTYIDDESDMTLVLKRVAE